MPIATCGRSSGVERNLAKVDVEGSNPFARSKNKPSTKGGFFVSSRNLSPKPLFFVFIRKFLVDAQNAGSWICLKMILSA